MFNLLNKCYLLEKFINFVDKYCSKGRLKFNILMIILNFPFTHQFLEVLDDKVFLNLLEYLTLFVVAFSLSVLSFIMKVENKLFLYLISNFVKSDFDGTYRAIFCPFLFALFLIEGRELLK